MDVALEEAVSAAARGEVPVGAVVVGPDGLIVAQAGNRTRELKDPTAHAEIIALRMAAGRLKSERLTNCDLYVTLEPCPMCAGAIAWARIRRLYYGASDPKSGGVEHGPMVFSHKQSHHVPEVYSGIASDQSANLLRGFFSERR